MSFNKTIPRLLVLLLLGAMLTSCVKNVDISQSQNITLNPDVQLDLLIFDVNERDFRDTLDNSFKTIIRDTVRLEFLDDDYIQQNLQQVAFKFKYLNTFPGPFTSKVSFLSEGDATQREVDFDISPGAIDNPSITEVTDLVPPSEIKKIKKSIKMLVEIRAEHGDSTLVGKLSFQAKGLFSFEF